jgi:hypothetical protein
MQTGGSRRGPAQQRPHQLLAAHGAVPLAISRASKSSVRPLMSTRRLASVSARWRDPGELDRANAGFPHDGGRVISDGRAPTADVAQGVAGGASGRGPSSRRCLRRFASVATWVEHDGRLWRPAFASRHFLQLGAGESTLVTTGERVNGIVNCPGFNASSQDGSGATSRSRTVSHKPGLSG